MEPFGFHIRTQPEEEGREEVSKISEPGLLVPSPVLFLIHHSQSFRKLKPSSQHMFARLIKIKELEKPRVALNYLFSCPCARTQAGGGSEYVFLRKTLVVP